MANSVLKLKLQSSGLSGDKSAILLLQNFVLSNSVNCFDAGVRLIKPISAVKAKKKNVKLSHSLQNKFNIYAGCALYCMRRNNISVLSGYCPRLKSARFCVSSRNSYGNFRAF